MSYKKLPDILVFASGTKTGGGSGFEAMVKATRSNPPSLNARICGVVTNHLGGGVWQKAKSLGVHVECWTGPAELFTAKGYQNYVSYFDANFVMLSGWLKLVAGLDPARTINIHPGPLPQFGGPKFYGHYVLEAVMASYHRGEITSSAVTMHFVDEKYDTGPAFFVRPVPIFDGDTPETLGNRVNREEHKVQSLALNHVIQGHVRLEGRVVVYATRDLRGMMMPAELRNETHIVAETHVNPTLR